jgi:hypothetical protein
VNNRFLAALCAAAVSASPALAASPLDSTFPAQPSPFLWTPFVDGSGPGWAFANGRLELSLPPGSSGSAFVVGLRSECSLQGDFDVSLEFLLLDWPLRNGVRTGIATNLGAVERTSFSTQEGYWLGETYLTHFADGVFPITTDDTAGVVRLVRATDAATGAITLTGYRMTADGGWAEIHRYATSGDDATISLQAWSHDWAFAPQGQTVRAAFTSFQIRSGRVACKVLPVGVDVKPGSTSNPIRVGSGGTTPVAFLGSSSFDAATIDPRTVAVAGAPVDTTPQGTLRTSVEDVNADGFPDLLVHVPTAAMNLPTGTTRVEATATTFAGQPVAGSDRVTLVP